MANLTAVIGADTSRFVEEVKSAKYMLNKFINDTKTQSGTIKKNTQVTNEQVASYQRVIKSLEKVGSGTMTAKQQQAALVNQIKELKIQWANLSDTAKNNGFGKSLASTLTEAQNKLKTVTTQINQTNTEMGKLGKNTQSLGAVGNIFNKFNSNLAGAAGAMNTLNIQGGQALSNIATKSSMIAGLGPTLANPYVLTGAAIVGAGAAIYKYNKDFEHTMRLTSEFTGLTGEALVNLRNGIKSVADTWDKDYREVLSAVDNLMVTYGIDGESALKVIRDGFIGGADDAGNLLSLIQQYSGSFKDAGISASELVAIIGNTRSGIFSEDGMALIEMAAKNIRLMKDSTVESLNAIGISADDMKKKLANGTMTTMQALQEISSKLKEFPPQSQEVGDVLQDVFGKKGSAAGTQLVTALADVQTNLDIVKGQTGDYGKSLEELTDADKRLEAAMAEMFGVTGAGWETVSTKAKTLFYEALILLINEVNDFKQGIQTWYTYTKAAIDQLSYSLNEFAAAWESLNNLEFDGVAKHLSNAFSTDKYNGEIKSYYKNLVNEHNKAEKKINNKPITPVHNINNNGGNNGGKGSGSGSKSRKGSGSKGGSNTVKYAKGSLSDLEKQLSDLQSKYKNGLLPKMNADEYKSELKRLEKEIKDKKIELGIIIPPLDGSIDKINEDIKNKQVELNAAITDESREKIQVEIDKLNKQKNEIEIKLKPVVKKQDLDNLEQKINEHNIEVKAEMKNAATSLRPKDAVSNAQNNADNLKKELDFNKQILNSYKQQHDAIKEKQALGGKLTSDEQKLASIYDDTTKSVERLSDAFEKASNNAKKLELDKAVKERTWDAFNTGVDTLGRLNGSVSNVASTWSGLSESWEDMSGFEQVTAGFDAVISTIQNVMEAYQSISTMLETFAALREAIAARNIATDQAETQSTVGKLGVQQAGSVANATEQGSKLPFPANIAAIAAGIAAVVAGFAMVFSCFADGGIIGGATSIGDYNIARVNKGEMILNGSQQKRLFNLLNADGNSSAIQDRKNNVVFTIKGQKLTGVLRNYNSKTKRI